MQKFFYNYPRKTREIVIDKPESYVKPVNNFSEIVQQLQPAAHSVISVSQYLN